MIELIFIAMLHFHTPPPPIISLSKQEERCLIRTTYHESKGEPFLGKMYVAQVTLNRSNSDKFPRNICKVISQKGAYQWYSSLPKNKHQVRPANTIQQESYEQIKFAVKLLKVLNFFKIDITNGALYFRSVKVKENKFFKKLHRIKKVDNHIFYRN